MGNQRGKIILLKVLDELDVDQFKMIKFLLSDIIKLSDKMQEEYDKVKIANLMVKRFPRDAGVDKLIQLCKDIPAFQGLVETLKESKVAKKVKSTPEKGTTPSKKSKQKEEGPSTLAPFTAEVTPGPQKRKSTAKGKDGTKRSKVSKEQPQSPCPVGASVSTAMGPPQTSSVCASWSPLLQFLLLKILMNLTLCLSAESFLVQGDTAVGSLSTALISFIALPL
uniref:Pyrin domain-containing protein n=1 Tax=Microcebus murinus TaxID=30608 RepID=A0A8C6EFF0_MICMU